MPKSQTSRQNQIVIRHGEKSTPVTPPPPPVQKTPVTSQHKGINVTDRAKNILITPKTEWAVIEKEQYSNQVILSSYILPMLLIGAVATFIGQGLIGTNTGFGSTAKGHYGFRFCLNVNVCRPTVVLDVAVCSSNRCALVHHLEQKRTG